MTIILNGEKFELVESSTISDLLKLLDLHPQGVAVEHNRHIINKAKYDETILKENDRVEIVHFVGGG
ncbi:MAG: sulfur carrier protein ThiS [Acidobacteriota bacterium]